MLMVVVETLARLPRSAGMSHYSCSNFNIFLKYSTALSVEEYFRKMLQIFKSGYVVI